MFFHWLYVRSISISLLILLLQSRRTLCRFYSVVPELRGDLLLQRQKLPLSWFSFVSPFLVQSKLFYLRGQGRGSMFFPTLYAVREYYSRCFTGDGRSWMLCAVFPGEGDAVLLFRRVHRLVLYRVGLSVCCFRAIFSRGLYLCVYSTGYGYSNGLTFHVRGARA